MFSLFTIYSLAFQLQLLSKLEIIVKNI